MNKTEMSVFNSWVNFSMLIFLLLLICNELLPQLFFILFRVYYPFDIVLKASLLFLILISFIFGNRFKPIGDIDFALLVFFIFLGIDLFIQLSNNSLQYILQGYNSFFYFSLIIYLLFICMLKDNSRIALVIMLFLGLVSSIIGIAQNVLNIPILNLGSDSQGFKILSDVFYGSGKPHVRGFGLFSSGLSFGIYLLYILPAAFYVFLEKYKWYMLIIVFIFTIAVYCTLTRNIYLGLLFVVPSVFIYRFQKKKILLFFLPLIAFLFGITSLFSGNILGQNGIGILDLSSLGIRQAQISKEIAYQINQDTISLLFGEGKYQSETEKENKILLDNTYLHVIKHIGLFGLIIFLLIYSLILRYTVRKPKSAVMCGLYCFLVAWPAMASINIIINELFMYTAFTIISGVGYTHLAKSKLKRGLKLKWR